jgi:hypothetical protein
MPSTMKQAKTTALESVSANPFTRVHGRPTHQNYKTLKEESSALAREIKDITYSWSMNATDNYGLLANILGADEYNELTRINSYAIPCKPASYDPSITNAMLTHEKKRKEDKWELIQPGLFRRVSSKASSTTYATPPTNNTTLSSSIASQHIETSPHIESLNTSTTDGAPSTFKQRGH